METLEENQLHGIAQLLMREGLLKQTDVLHYQQLATSEKLSLPQYLVTHHMLSAQTIAKMTAEHFNVPFIDLDDIDIASIPVSLIDEKLIHRHFLIPLYIQNNQLYVATDDPSNRTSLKEIQFHTGWHINPLVAETDKLRKLIDRLLHKKETRVTANYFASDDTPVVTLVNQVLLEAIKKKASDIHFEPYEESYRIRYRQDGLLSIFATPPLSLSTRIAARIKIMSNLDISEKRLPQDGQFKIKQNDSRTIHFRVSTCPTVAGEKIVIRLLDPENTNVHVETLGFSLPQKTQFLDAIHRPQGMILVTGPTGCGKTVTLYSALNILNTLEKNISTVEDPVEIKVPGMNQVTMNMKTGLTFSKILRSFLRQDPDIIMVGEIRDLETAEIAIKAAQTGHLVLSTLHTNSATETLSRLINMGIPSFHIASSVSLIVAQRLVRRLCDHCKIISHDLVPQSLIELNQTPTQTYKAYGCDQCTHGYKGRFGLFEVLPMSKEIAHIMMSGGNADALLEQAKKEGMLTMYQAGIEHIKAGTTTIEEINRVTVE